MTEQRAKYEEIVEWITKQIDNGELSEGEKIYSENKLVSIFQVSRQTVRHAISVLVERGLLVSRRGSGTYVRDSRYDIHGRKKVMCIAAMMTYADGYIFPSIINVMERILSREGYDLRINFTYNEVERERGILRGFLESDSIDGVIAEATKSGIPNPNIKMYHQLQEKGIPVVFINCYYEELKAIHVCMDDFLAGKTVTEHLLQYGHRKIGGIFKLEDGQGHKRYAGYMQALLEYGLEFDDRCVIWMDTLDFEEMDLEPERYLRRLKNCTACVCYNDEVAAKLMGICRVAGIEVPEVLSIVGIDDSDVARYCEVPLTSANNPVEDLAKNAADIMLQLLSGKNLTENVELKPKLVIRDSARTVGEFHGNSIRKGQEK